MSIELFLAGDLVEIIKQRRANEHVVKDKRVRHQGLSEERNKLCPQVCAAQVSVILPEET